MATEARRRSRRSAPSSAARHVSSRWCAIRAVRGAGQRALHARADAGPRAPLHRRGGGRRRRLRGAAQRRLHHEHAPRPRPLPGQGRVAATGCSPSCSARRPATARARAARCTSPIRETGNLGANAIVGGSAGIATGAALSREDARHGPGRGLLLRRRRARPGPALRGDEPGRALEAAGHLRLREQPLQRVHALLGDDRRRRSSARAAAFGIPAETVDGQDVRAVHTRRARARRARARGEGPAFLMLQDLPLPRPPRRRHRPRLLPLRRRKSRSGSTSATRSTLLGDWLIARGRRRPRRRSSAIEDELDRGDGRRRRVRARRAVSRTRAEVDRGRLSPEH